MPFKQSSPVKLNSGHTIPGITFGASKIPTPVCAEQVDQAISVGFDAVETAQLYDNEARVGQAIKESGLARQELWVSSKWSGGYLGGKRLGIRESCEASLNMLRIERLDMYLIHSPHLCDGDIPSAWEAMEKLVKDGLTKSIGVSNFSIQELAILLGSCRIVPAVNQIPLHPYIIKRTTPLLEFMHKRGIVVQGTSTLLPLASPGGPLDSPLTTISQKYIVKPEQVLLAWSKAKGAVVVTTSSKKARLEGFLAAGDMELTDEEVREIDQAGMQGECQQRWRKALRDNWYFVVVGLMASVSMYLVIAG